MSNKRPISAYDKWIVDENNNVIGFAPAGTSEETTLAIPDAVNGVTPGTGAASKVVVLGTGKEIAGIASIGVDGAVVNANQGMVTVGSRVGTTATEVGANAARVAGYTANMLNSADTITGLKGCDFRVNDAAGTTQNVNGGQFVGVKSAGTSVGELWGANCVAQLNGGAMTNAYGVVGDLTVAAGATVAGTDPNCVAAAGFFTSFIDTTAVIAHAIDAAVVGCISGEETRGRSAKGTYGVVAMLNGSAGTESTEGATAGFKVLTFATAAGATFDYGLDLYYLDGAKSNRFTKADQRLSTGVEIYSGAETTRGAVRTAVGTQGAIGSLYLSTAGKMYLKTAAAGADTDWEKVTTTAAD